MNLYLISQDENNDYDTFDSAVVCAADEAAAREIHPGSRGYASYKFGDRAWCKSPDAVKVTLIGTASPDVEPGVVLAPFNAG